MSQDKNSVASGKTLSGKFLVFLSQTHSVTVFYHISGYKLIMYACTVADIS